MTTSNLENRVPTTDAEVQENLDGLYRPEIARPMWGIYQCQRHLGKEVLAAWIHTLETHAAMFTNLPTHEDYEGFCAGCRNPMPDVRLPQVRDTTAAYIGSVLRCYCHVCENPWQAVLFQPKHNP